MSYSKYYKSFQGHVRPFTPIDEAEFLELKDLDTYYRCEFDDREKLVGLKKIALVKNEERKFVLDEFVTPDSEIYFIVNDTLSSEINWSPVKFIETEHYDQYYRGKVASDGLVGIAFRYTRIVAFEENYTEVIATTNEKISLENLSVLERAAETNHRSELVKIIIEYMESNFEPAIAKSSTESLLKLVVDSFIVALNLSSLKDQEKLEFLKIFEFILTELSNRISTDSQNADLLPRAQSLLSDAQTRSYNIDAEVSRLQSELKQVGELRRSLDEKEKELDRLRKAATELEQSRLRIDSLSKSLSIAEQEATAAKQNDLELRRLFNEMKALQSERDKSVSSMNSLEKRIQQQEQQIVQSKRLESRIKELESLEADIVRRDRQIAELKKRLADLQPASAAQQASTAKSNKPKTNEPRKPLYVAPKERDDLKKINGIGPVMERILNDLGITSFKQIAEFQAADIAKVTEAIEAFPGRIERDNWVGGAQEQYEKKHNKKVRF